MRWRRQRPLLLGASGPQYRTTIDRMGLALGTGAVAGGVVAALASTPDPLAWLVAFAGGAVLTLLAAVVLGAPLWWLAGRAELRGPVTAAAVGAGTGLVLFVGAQAAGFGGADATTIPYRWISAAATSLLLAAPAAGVALAMWRVAYRRVR